MLLRLQVRRACTLVILILYPREDSIGTWQNLAIDSGRGTKFAAKIVTSASRIC